MCGVVQIFTHTFILRQGLNTKQRLLHCACRTRQRADAYHKSHECDIHLVAPLVPLCMYIYLAVLPHPFGSGPLSQTLRVSLRLKKHSCSCTVFPHAHSVIHIGSVSGWFTPLPKPSHPAKQHREFPVRPTASANNPLHSLVAGPRKGQPHSCDRTFRPVAHNLLKLS